MTRLRWLAVATFALMLFAAIANAAITPRIHAADTRRHDLERLIPKSFGGWTAEEPHNVILPDPAAQRLQDKLYNAVLTRLYRNQDGTAIMLVIAYGGDQSDALQLHRPEVCYAASGYAVRRTSHDDERLAGRAIHMTRVGTQDGIGYEPVSYWMRVGDRQVTTNLDRQIAKLSAGLNGIVPDGVLVRVSTRQSNADSTQAYETQDRFIADLLASVDSATRELLVGSDSVKRS